MKEFTINKLICHLDRRAAEWRPVCRLGRDLLRKGVLPLEIPCLPAGRSPRQNDYSKRSRVGCGIEMTARVLLDS